MPGGPRGQRYGANPYARPPPATPHRPEEVKGAPAVCLEWSTTRALAAGATEDEIADVLLAIAPVAGLGRVTAAIPDLAAALGYDVEAELIDPDDH